MDKNYREILDYSLKFLFEKWKNLENFERLETDGIPRKDVLNKELADRFNLENWELIMINNQLLKDQFVNEDFILTLDGLYFYKNLGYVKKEKIKIDYDQRVAFHEFLLSYGALFAAIGSISYLLWDVYKFLYEHYPKFQ